jgi:hypothetical protein
MALAGVLFLGACGSSHPPPLQGCNAPQNGIMWVVWTFSGQPADSTACSGVDSLTIVGSPTDTPGCQFTITDVSCQRGTTPFEYDYLPQGNLNLEIDALDKNASQLKSGTAFFNIGPTKPAQAVPIDLR